MQSEEEQNAAKESSPPVKQPVLLTPTKQAGKDNHLLTTLHCSRQLVFVVTPTKQEPQMFSSLLSEERNDMVDEVGLSESSRVNRERGSVMQEEFDGSSEEDQAITEFERMIAEEDKMEEEPVLQLNPTLALPNRREPEEKSGRQRRLQEPQLLPRPVVRTCNCKRSGCLKKYCECYKAGQACSNLCECQSCQNSIQREHLNQRPKSVAKLSCNCKKSECSKNYCECHSAGQLCNEECKCLDCKNTYEGTSRLRMLAALSKTTAKKSHRHLKDDE